MRFSEISCQMFMIVLSFLSFYHITFAFAILIFSYLLVSLWAIDSGMALTGFIKFLPLLLFYVLLSGQQEEREKMISILPLLGSLMTLFSFLIPPTYKNFVIVATHTCFKPSRYI